MSLFKKKEDDVYKEPVRCLKCKRQIKDKDDEYLCSKCEKGPYHEDCLDDDGNCPKCTEETERESESGKYRVVAETEGSTYVVKGDLSEDEASKHLNDLVSKIENDKKTTIEVEDDELDYLIIYALIGLKIEEE